MPISADRIGFLFVLLRVSSFFPEFHVKTKDSISELGEVFFLAENPCEISHLVLMVLQLNAKKKSHPKQTKSGEKQQRTNLL